MIKTKMHNYSTLVGLVLIVIWSPGFTNICFAQEERIKIDVELVNLKVVVMDRQGHRVSGLTKDDFEVYEDSTQQEISHFATEDQALNLVLLFDLSISMEEVLPTVKQEALRLLDNLRPDDRINVLSFASDVRANTDWVDPSKARALVRALEPEPHPQPLPAALDRPGYNVGDGNTYIYEALRYVFDNYRADGDRIAVVMFSDGVDTGAGRSMNRIEKRAEEIGKEVKRQAQECWALVYPIRYKTQQMIGDIPKPAWRPVRGISIHQPPDPGRQLFSDIATTTGGVVFEWTTRQDLVVALQQALTDLRSRYSLAYKPPRTGPADSFHRIKVKVKHANLVVRSREGYRLPK
ncbi:MAG TPA: VWA domain-containing protein [Pyrinomonadaceae bacterium]|nr:VWA domain-containing protein [Pyrinomonadaceae bacterium]